MSERESELLDELAELKEQRGTDSDVQPEDGDQSAAAVDVPPDKEDDES
ncbi:hypothetical protein [Micromonospora inositola]|uniref:Uncharacterized protein n=1 Tax=Micromonospora inositola TaxID=47865 RepID=A0A1C5JWL2_9ACTN|nr:hypothetical protein [Micromonospora inositola]SCG74878.1 hypothetical protein GA0070613_5638 [Micromonospora inositola]